MTPCPLATPLCLSFLFLQVNLYLCIKMLHFDPNPITSRPTQTHDELTAKSRCLQYITAMIYYKTTILLHKVKTQYVHCRLIASYFLLPWRNVAEMSR